MNLLKNVKFQLAIVGLVVAVVMYFVPDLDEKSLVEVVTAIVALVLGGHGIVEWRNK